MRSPHKPPRSPSNQPSNQPPREIYAPETKRSPEAGTSPLMWAWFLFTVLLAGLVAWGWVQYLQSPQPSTSKTAPAPTKPALPTLPTEPTQPPIAPPKTDLAPVQRNL